MLPSRSRFGLCLLLLGLSAVAALVFAGSAADQPQSTVNQVAAAANVPTATPTVMEQINRLPEDGGYYSATLFVHTDWQSRPEEKSLVDAWPELSHRLLPYQKVKFFCYDEASPICAAGTGFHPWVSTLPTALIQRGDGYVLYKNYGANMLGPTQDEPERLFHRRHPCPGPAPTPKPDVNVNVNTAPAPAVPDKVIPDAVEEKHGFHLVLLVCCIAVAGVAAVFYFRNRVAGSSIVS